MYHPGTLLLMFVPVVWYYQVRSSLWCDWILVRGQKAVFFLRWLVLVCLLFVLFLF
jgi:hypothetical protein